jgi:hypothetical protein
MTRLEPAASGATVENAGWGENRLLTTLRPHEPCPGDHFFQTRTHYP